MNIWNGISQSILKVRNKKSMGFKRFIGFINFELPVSPGLSFMVIDDLCFASSCLS